MRGGGPRDDEHAVGFVAVLGVRGREVDVPAVVEGVQLGGPEVARVFFVGWGTPWGGLVGHVVGVVPT